jgi:hypothetical protein
LPLFEDADVGRVRRGEVIGVGAVFELQLPVGLERERHRAGHQFEAIRALIGDEIQQLGRFAQMCFQRRHVCIEAAEQEAAIFAEGGQGGQVVALRVEALGIAAGALQFHVLVAAALSKVQL